MEIKVKQCNKCGVTMSIDNFQKHSAYTGGHINMCKKCVYEYAKERRKDPDVRAQMNKNSKIWRKRTPEKTLQRRIRTSIKFLQINGYEIRKDGFIKVN
jgi:DNA-directed RNA polymerase subunit M/transcription elongation factor TFIIS